MVQQPKSPLSGRELSNAELNVIRRKLQNVDTIFGHPPDMPALIARRPQLSLYASTVRQ